MCTLAAAMKLPKRKWGKDVEKWTDHIRESLKDFVIRSNSISSKMESWCWRYMLLDISNMVVVMMFIVTYPPLSSGWSIILAVVILIWKMWKSLMSSSQKLVKANRYVTWELISNWKMRDVCSILSLHVMDTFLLNFHIVHVCTLLCYKSFFVITPVLEGLLKLKLELYLKLKTVS